MPNCNTCSETQSKLNPGGLCRTCYNDCDGSTNTLGEINNESYWNQMNGVLDAKLKKLMIKEWVVEETNRQIEPIKIKTAEYGQILQNQQSLLELMANNGRKENLIFSGVQEENADVDTVNEICQVITPELIEEQKLVFTCKRLGNNEARKPRPILVELSGQCKMEAKNKILSNAKSLKDNDRYKKVYITRDIHPV